MAVARMLKLQLISHDSNREQLLTALQKSGLVEITHVKETDKEEFAEVAAKEEAGELHLLLSRINFCLDFLNRFEQKKKGFFASLIPDKIVISPSTYHSIVDKLPFTELYEKLERLEIALRKTESAITESRKKLKELEPWIGYKVPLGIKETDETLIKTGHIHSSVMKELSEKLQKESELVQIDVIKELGVIYFVAVLIHKSQGQEVLNLLNKYGFKEVSLSGFNQSAEKEAAEMEEQVQQLEKEKENLIQQAQDLLYHKQELTIAYDYVSNLLEKAEIQETFRKTPNCFFLGGWVADKDKQSLKELLKHFDTADIKFSEASAEDNPPVKLQNKDWVKPFEVITSMYGQPAYNELDPTPFLAPFFIFFFGLALGDVGYGIVLALGAWFLKKRLNLSENSQKLLTIFIYGGIASVFGGIITGGYFAVDPANLPLLLQKMALFDPLKNPIPFLIFALILGIIQVLAGTIIEIYDSFRNKHLIDGILDNVPIILMIVGGSLLVWWLFIWAKGGEAPAWSPYAKWLTIAGAIGVVVFSNRQSKSIVGKIGGGLYNLYGMSAYLGDIISYARLMALGLATFLVGWAFNIMAGMIFQSSIVIGIIFFFILIFLHLFNLVINLIGAFVHPARLQYVEFFSKFFEGGGKKFEPFSLKTKKVHLK